MDETKKSDYRIKKSAEMVSGAIKYGRESTFKRFPVLFTLLSAFGLVATFYGFEKVIDSFGFSTNPWAVLVLGLVVLIFTGSLYKKL
jgi:hypothetical protein